MPRETETAKSLPHNADAERAVLGSILIDNSRFEEVHKYLQTFSDFFLPFNQVVFSEMLIMREAHEPIDELTLVNWLVSKGKLDSAGGAGYISSLTDGLHRLPNLDKYCQLIRSAARLRQIIKFSDSVQRSAMEPSANPEDITQQWSKILTDSATLHTNGNGHGRHAPYSLTEFLNAEFPVPDHLVEGLVPRGGSVLILAMPHRLKSWFTTGLALGCTKPGRVMGCLEVKNPVRTMIVQVEDPEGIVQGRMRQLILTKQFQGCDPEMVRIVGRGQFIGGYTKEWSQWLLRYVREFKADHVILDVLRRFFVGRGDLNSPGDSGDFLEEIDLIRDTGAAVTLVHHENRKDAELMGASAGSYNFPGWANVVIQLKRKTEVGQGDERITRVEIEADNKLGVAPDSLRLVLNLNSPELPLHLEEVGEGDDWREVMENLGEEWTVKDLAEELGVHRRSAQRRIKAWITGNKVERISGGKRGRMGGLARYRFRDAAAVEDTPPPAPMRGRVQ